MKRSNKKVNRMSQHKKKQKADIFGVKISKKKQRRSMRLSLIKTTHKTMRNDMIKMCSVYRGLQMQFLDF